MPEGSRQTWVIRRLGWLLVCCTLVPPQANAGEATSRVVDGVIYTNARAFRIPLNIGDSDRARLREIQLFVSVDLGQNWKLAGKVAPDQSSFTFRADRDAEYWFATRSQDTNGKYYPESTTAVKADRRVVVDTVPPTLTLEQMGRRGERTKVRWEISDENLDAASLALSYRAEGARDFRQVPITKPALIGAEEFSSGTAAPLEVQATVKDNAGNVTTAKLDVQAGVASASERPADDVGGFGPPPPISPIRSEGSANPSPNYASEMSGFGGAGGNQDQFFGPPDGFNSRSASISGPGARPSGRMTGAAPIRGAEASAPEIEPMLVSSPQFNLQYAVDGASSQGPALVELWVTRDGGRTWTPQAEDADKKSPYQVDLGGEGTFGLWLVVQSASGLGDPPPQSGDRPMQWVVVDTTPPSVQLDPPQVGYGPQLGKVLITWRASDPHIDQRPVVLTYRNADEPGGVWQNITDRIDNTGRFVWTVPPNVPPRLHLRIDVVDRLGNQGFAETSNSGTPVIVDRSRPRGRILGLDPKAGANETRR